MASTIQPASGISTNSCHQPDLFVSCSRRAPTAINGITKASITKGVSPVLGTYTILMFECEMAAHPGRSLCSVFAGTTFAIATPLTLVKEIFSVDAAMKVISLLR